MNRRTFLLGLLVLAGCGYPKPVDPPIYFYRTAEDAYLAAVEVTKNIKGAIRYWVKDTHSMEPLLWGGDWIVVDTTVSFDSLKPGQVITYKAEWYLDTPVTHRIAVIDKAGLLMSGDNAPKSEPQWRVGPSGYIGLVVGIYTARQRQVLA